MVRLAISALLLAGMLSHGQTIQGKVVNPIEQPLKGARVCLLGFADRCTQSDDSGSWSLTLPAGIREGAVPGSDKGLFRIRQGSHSLTLVSHASDPLHLDWLDALGRPLAARGIPLPSRLSGSLRLDAASLATLPEGVILLRARYRQIESAAAFMHLRGAVLEIRRQERPEAKPLAKAAYYLSYYVEASLAGYETEIESAVEPPNIEWINLRPLGETRDPRSYAITLPVLSIQREAGYIQARSAYTTCESGKTVERVSEVKLPFHLHEGKLYIPRSGDNCRSDRFTGNGADILGSWVADGLLVETPAPFRPAGCPSVLPFSRPIDYGATVVYRFSDSEIGVESSGPTCLSDERWYTARNLIMQNDRTVRWIENSCRRTAWVNSAGDSAFQTFQVHGGRDSALVTFAYKDKTCSYIDGGMFSDPPPSCPDPEETAMNAYLDCIAASGFANITTILRKPAASGPAPFRRLQE